jgi:hypothetical protein
MGLDAGQAVGNGGTANPPADTAATAVPDAIVTAVQSFFANTSGKPATLVGVKLNQIGTDGKYTQPTTVEHLYPGTGIAPSGTTAFPPQVSLAVTLDSGLRGARRRGRFFVPYPNLALNATTGQFADSSIADAMTNALAFVHAINGVAGTHVVVASSAGTGGFALVTGLRIGTRPDVIRSRGGKIQENYAKATV